MSGPHIYAIAQWVKNGGTRSLEWIPGRGAMQFVQRVDDIEFGDKERIGLMRENGGPEWLREDEVVAKGIKALGMTTMEYLESILGGTLGGTSPQPDSPVSAGSSHDDSDVPAA